MSEKMNTDKNLTLRYLPREEKSLSRALYEAVFSEDTERFVDYYYQYKIKDNRILTLWEEEKLVSMLHLNPYAMIVNGYEVKSDYIVAVATNKDYRHQGYMRLLLERALNDVAFVFLMPASESIYAPFDFVWICPHTDLPARVNILDAEEQNRYLAARYQMFCKRDERYMENLAAERAATRGEAPDDKIPPYMARITDVCQMLRLVRSRETKILYLHVRDTIIEKNNGYFVWETSAEGSKAIKAEDILKYVDMELTVGELASMIFGGFRICLSEMV